MRSADICGPGTMGASRAVALAAHAIACLMVAVGVAGCAGLGGGSAGKDAGDTATASAAKTGTQKPALIPDLDPAVINAFEAALGELHAGHTAEAEKGFLALTKSHPDLGGPHANLGIVYRETGKPEQAIAELERAVACNPQQPVFWNQLGIAYRQQGQFAKARDAYEHAIALDPGYPAPTLNMGILFDLYLWDGKRALELYDRYLTLTPGGDPKVVKWVADLKNRNREGKSEPHKEKE